MQLPSYVQIEPVGRCNLRCPMCAVRFREEPPPALMAWELFTRIVDEVPTLEYLHLQGLGEPLLHPRFFDMVRYAVSRGLRVTTNTNVTLIGTERAVECVTSGLDTLHASVDALTPEVYESIRVNANFEHATQNLRGITETRKRFGSATPEIHLVAVLMRRNLHELPGLVRLAHALPADELFVQRLCHDFDEAGLPAAYAPMRAFVEAETLLSADPDEVTNVFDEARDLARQLGVALRLPRLRPHPYAPGTPGRSCCDWPWSGAYVTYDGQLMPCCMASTPDRAQLGTLAEGSFAELWNGAAYAGFRAALDSPDPPEICRSCALYRGTF